PRGPRRGPAGPVARGPAGDRPPSGAARPRGPDARRGAGGRGDLGRAVAHARPPGGDGLRDTRGQRRRDAPGGGRAGPGRGRRDRRPALLPPVPGRGVAGAPGWNPRPWCRRDRRPVVTQSPDDRRYPPSHEWVEGDGTLTIGITRYAADQ